MNILCIKHVDFEGPATIAEWAEKHAHTITTHHVFRESALPPADSFEMLVVMGGPMNIYEEDEYPWLKPEKAFIKKAIDSGKKVLGICLGAQLIADLLGGKVTRGKYKEIGALDIEMTAEGLKAMPELPAKFKVFQWHGDTFAIPSGAIHLARSEACENQAFIYKEKIIALQFHLESTKKSVSSLVEKCEGDIKPGPYVSSKEILKAIPEEFFNASNKFMFKIMDRLAEA